MQKFCSNCGHPGGSKDKVCRNCGTSLTNSKLNNQQNISSTPPLNTSSQKSGKKRHAVYKWFIGVGVSAILAEGGYLVYQNMTSPSNSSVMESSSHKASTVSAKNSESVQSIDTEKSNNQESSSANDDGSQTVADIGPKTLASSVLVLMEEKDSNWKSLIEKDNLEVNVAQDSESNKNYSEPGTGVSYYFTSDGNNFGQLIEYRISSDGSTIYCYNQPTKDSATRHVTPFATFSAKDVQQVKNSAAVQDLVDKIEVNS